MERLEGCFSPFLHFARVFWCGDATWHSSLPRSPVPLPGFVVWGCHLAFLLPPVFVHPSGLSVWGCHLAFLPLPGFSFPLFLLQVLVINSLNSMHQRLVFRLHRPIRACRFCLAGLFPPSFPGSVPLVNPWSFALFGLRVNVAWFRGLFGMGILLASPNWGHFSGLY